MTRRVLVSVGSVAGTRSTCDRITSPPGFPKFSTLTEGCGLDGSTHSSFGVKSRFVTPGFLNSPRYNRFMTNEDDEIIDPEELDSHTLRAVQRLINDYPVLQTGEPHHSLNDYRQGPKDAFTAVSAVLSEWLDDLEDTEEE